MVLLHELLVQTAASAPGRMALAEEGRRIGYGELVGAAGTLAGALQRLGVTRGARVAVLGENSIDAGVSLWAALLAGGVAVPISAATRAGRVRRIIADCAPTVLIAAEGLAGVVDEALADLAPRPSVVWNTPPPGRQNEPSLREVLAGPAGGPADPGLIDQDLGVIIYTSGTTGEPKGVMLTHRNLVHSTGSIVQYLRQGPDDVVCCVLSLAFSYGLFQLFAAGRAGSGVILERSFAFPYDVLRRVQEQRATMLPGVPTMFAKLLQLHPLRDIDLGSLRCLTNAAAPLPPAHALRLGAALPGAELFLMYGQTECTRAAFLDPRLVRTHPGSCGRATPGCAVYLIDPAGRRLGAGSEGELIVRGSNVMRGYWQRPEETARKLHDGEIAGERVLHTGDRFRIDAEGLLHFLSRTDDIFKCRGEKVAPLEIEHVLCELPEVAEAAVVGVEDAGDGMAIKAVIVLRAGADVSEARVRQHCRARLEAVFVPRFIEIRDSLPRTDNGKLRRRDLAGPPRA